MNKYDVRRERNRTATQADISSLQNYENITKTLVSDLPQTINQIGGIIGNQQATDYINKENEAFKKDVADGKLTYKTDDNGNIIYDASGSPIPLSSEEMFNAREAWFSRYAANNPQPNNPWAQNVIKKSHDSSVASWIASIAETSLKKYQEQIDTNMMNAINAYADSTSYDPDTILSTNGITEKQLSSESLEFYKDASGTSESPKYSKRLSYMLLGAQTEYEKAGYSPLAAKQAVINNCLPAFRDKNTLDDIAGAYQTMVIEEGRGEDEFDAYLNEYINGLGVNGKGDYNMPISTNKKSDLTIQAKSRIDSIRENHKTEVRNKWQSVALPAIYDTEDRNVPITSNKMMQILRDANIPTSDIRFLEDNTQMLIHDITQSNDSLVSTLSVVNQLNGIYQMDGKSNSEKIKMAEDVISKITDPHIMNNVVALGQNSNVADGRWSNQSIEQIAISNVRTFSSQPDVLKSSGTSGKSNVSSDIVSEDGVITEQSKFITDSTYRTFGFSVVLEVQNQDFPLTERNVFNDQVAREMFIQQMPYDKRAEIYLDNDSINDSFFESEETESEFQKYKSNLYQRIMTDYLNNTDYKFADGSTLKSMLEEMQKDYDAEYLTYAGDFYVTGGLKQREKIAADNKNAMYGKIVEASSTGEMSALYMEFMNNKAQKYYTEEDYNDLVQYFNGTWTDALKKKNINLKDSIRIYMPEIKEDSPWYNDICQNILMACKSDILGDTDPITARQNVDTKIKEIYEDTMIGKAADSLTEVNRWNKDSRNDWTIFYNDKEARNLAGDFINGSANPMVQEFIEGNFSGVIGKDGQYLNADAMMNSFQLQDIVYSNTEDAIKRSKNDRWLMCLANALQTDINLNNMSSDEAWNYINRNMENLDPVTQMLTIQAANTLYGISDIYEELYDDWGLTGISVYGDGTTFALGDYELKATIENGTIKTLKGRKKGSDNKNWVDMTILSPSMVESSTKAWRSATLELANQRKENARFGIGVFSNKPLTRSDKEKALSYVTVNDNTLNAYLTFYKGLFNKDYHLTFDSLNNKVIFAPIGGDK